MKTMRNKLRTKSGSTIIFALVFFLFCAMIGGIILTSAYTNVNRAAKARDTQQSYFTVSSAARLIAEELEGIEFEGLENDYDSSVDYFECTKASDVLSNSLLPMAEKIFYEASASTVSKQFSLSVPDSEEVTDVTATLMLTDKTATVHLTLDSAPDKYEMTLTVPITHSTRTVTGTVTETDVVDGEEVSVEIPYEETTITIKFGTAVIEKGAA